MGDNRAIDARIIAPLLLSFETFLNERENDREGRSFVVRMRERNLKSNSRRFVISSTLKFNSPLPTLLISKIALNKN